MERVLGLITVLSLLLLGSGVVSAQSVEQTAYWQTQYGELLPSEDARAARAHTIFARVLRAAGTRPGVVAHLVILERDPWGYALPIALPHGGIILSRKVLDFCYQDPARGDDRLAFILGHEIAHQLRDDFWHLRFFQALGAATERHPGTSEQSTQWQALIGSPTEGRLAQELQADQYGIIYAAMAGFNTQAIVAEEPRVNFFQDWLQTRDPHHLLHQPVARSHPTPSQRAEALMAHLQQVIANLAVFEAGLWFYYAGDYAKAINAFTQFLAHFPGHEVYHNLAVSHHQLALQAYRLWQGDAPAMPFQLSMAIDPLTRASQIFLRQQTRAQRGTTTSATPETLFRLHLDQAIEQYRQARAHDETYTPAATNLGGALLLRGLHARGGRRDADLYEAVATLQRALEYAPNASHTLNNLGVALFYVERLADAKSHLQRARTLAPAYVAPVFNLATIARTERLQVEAQHYQRAYEALTRQPPLEPSADSPEPEYIMELGIGHLEAQVPTRWGTPSRHAFRVENTPFTMATYPQGIRTLTREGEILLVRVQDGYGGSSKRGITIGSPARDILARYGAPTRRAELTQGESWSYDAHRIAFQLREGTVVSWLLF